MGRRAVHFSVHPEEELGPQLRALGVGARDIRHVVLTHLHTDHAGGLFHVTGVRTWVARGEFDRDLACRQPYYTRVAVAPDNPDALTNRGMALQNLAGLSVTQTGIPAARSLRATFLPPCSRRVTSRLTSAI